MHARDVSPRPARYSRISRHTRARILEMSHKRSVSLARSNGVSRFSFNQPFRRLALEKPSPRVFANRRNVQVDLAAAFYRVTAAAAN